MESYLSQWMIDVSSVCSVIGLFLTFVVWLKTKQIKKDLISKSRLPKISKELSLEISAHLEIVQRWRHEDGDSQVLVNDSALKLGKIKGILGNTRYHVSAEELKAVNQMLKQLSKKKYRFLPIPLNKLKFDEVETLSIELNQLSSMLQQRVKDLRIPV